MIYALVVADILMIGSFILKYPSLPPQVPLMYTRAWGEDQLVDSWYLLILPVLLQASIFFNIFLYNHYFFPDQVMKKIFSIAAWGYIVGYTLIFLKIITYIT